jgi:hypothetical protein
VTLGLKYKLATLIFGGARHHLISDAHAEHAHQVLTRMLSARISSWPVCSGYASVPDAYAKHVLKGLRSVHTLVPDAYAQCTHQFLTRMLSARISSWHACSACAWVPDPYSQPVHKSRSMRVSSSKFSIIFKVPKTKKILKQSPLTLTNGLKSFQKKKFFAPN